MKKKSIIIILILALAITGLIVFVAYSNSIGVRFKKQIDVAQKYVVEMNYEEAIIAYKVAIEIDPLGSEAYIGLASVYIMQDDYKHALEVLQQGAKLIDDEEIAKMIKECEDELNKRAEEARRKAEEEQKEKEKNVIDKKEFEEYCGILTSVRYDMLTNLSIKDKKEIYLPIIEATEAYINQYDDVKKIDIMCNQCGTQVSNEKILDAICHCYLIIDEPERCKLAREKYYSLTRYDSLNPNGFDRTFDGGDIESHDEYGRIIEIRKCSETSNLSADIVYINYFKGTDMYESRTWTGGWEASEKYEYDNVGRLKEIHNIQDSSEEQTTYYYNEGTGYYIQKADWGEFTCEMVFDQYGRLVNVSYDGYSSESNYCVCGNVKCEENY